MSQLPLVDGHLDLAELVTLFGRDLTTSVTEIRQRENRSARQATVSISEIERGGIAVVITTVTPGFLAADVGKDFEPRSALYRTPEEAEANALAQVGLYENWERNGRVRLLKSVSDLEDHLALWTRDGKPGLVLLMESADAIVRVSDLRQWWQRGLRMIGLTLGDTRYGAGVSGGSRNFKKGGLTEDGFALLDSMAERGFTWDVTHLADEGICEGLERNFPRVCATHANARALTPTDRHLTDEVIRKIADRNGMIGLVLYNGYLDRRWRNDRTLRVTLSEHLAQHANHIARVGGWGVVGIGSDLDGGFGLEETPEEIQSIADLSKVASAVPRNVRDAVLSTNWLTFLRNSLPKTA